MLGQSATLPKSKETREKVIKFMRKAAFDSIKKRLRIHIVEFYKKGDSRNDYLKVEISFRENSRHLCLPKECLIGPIDEEGQKSVINDSDYCFVCFDQNNKHKEGIFMLITSMHV
jgi:hypothetical protein